MTVPLRFRPLAVGQPLHARLQQATQRVGALQRGGESGSRTVSTCSKHPSAGSSLCNSALICAQTSGRTFASSTSSATPSAHPSTLHQLTTASRTLYRQWRHNPRQTFNDSYDRDRYIWWALFLLYGFGGAVLLYKNKYAPIVNHPTVEQALNFLSSSTLYKQYLREVGEADTELNTDTLPALIRGQYFDGKHNQQQSRLVFRAYTPTKGRHTVWVQCEGLNLSRTTQYDSAGQPITRNAPQSQQSPADWQLTSLRVYFPAMSKAYNFNMQRQQWEAVNDPKQLSVFSKRSSNQFTEVSSMVEDETTADSDVSSSSSPSLTSPSKLEWLTSQRGLLVGSLLIGFPILIGLRNRTRYREEVGYRYVMQNLQSQYPLLHTFYNTNNVLLQNKYSGIVNRKLVHATVDVNDDAGQKQGQVRIEAINQEYEQNRDAPNSVLDRGQWRIQHVALQKGSKQQILKL